MALAQSCLNTGAIFSSCPRMGGNRKSQAYWPVGDIYYQTRSGNISVPAESSRCLREEGAAPHPDQLLHPFHCSSLQMLMSAPGGEKKETRGWNPCRDCFPLPRRRLGCTSNNSAGQPSPLLNAAAPLPCCGPANVGRSSHGWAHVGRQLRLSRPDCATAAYAS